MMDIWDKSYVSIAVEWMKENDVVLIKLLNKRCIILMIATGRLCLLFGELNNRAAE